MAKTRIQKMLSEAGVASRRHIEEMIGEGRVTVNGKLVVELPCFVEPGDRITVDGQRIRLQTTTKKRYVLLNKPRNVVCTSHDPQGRKRAVDCVPAGGGRLYCVGRLDADSTGIILLTNDGELTQHLTHPSHEVVKTYHVQIDGRLTPEKIDRFKKGVWLDGKPTAGAGLRIVTRHAAQSVLEIKLREGRNREIRRVLARLGYKVRRLHRSAIGPITDRGLGVGSCRELTAKEVQSLQKTGGSTGSPPPAARRQGSKPAGAAKPARKRTTRAARANPAKPTRRRTRRR